MGFFFTQEGGRRREGKGREVERGKERFKAGCERKVKEEQPLERERERFFMLWHCFLLVENVVQVLV